MSDDKEFQNMLDNLDIVVESMEEGHTVITPRVVKEKNRKTQKDI